MSYDELLNLFTFKSVRRYLLIMLVTPLHTDRDFLWNPWVAWLRIRPATINHSHTTHLLEQRSKYSYTKFSMTSFIILPCAYDFVSVCILHLKNDKAITYFCEPLSFFVLMINNLGVFGKNAVRYRVNSVFTVCVRTSGMWNSWNWKKNSINDQHKLLESATCQV